jgi:hypothetical protein
MCEAAHACPVSHMCAPGREAPCDRVGRSHEMKLDLCRELEAIADGLPARIDRRKCLIVASSLVPLLRESHAYEEKCVFPAYAAYAASEAPRLQTVRRLKTEHVEDECAAQDLTEILLSIGHGAPVDNPEALGFMLRAFFEAMRRHIAFEREHIFPIILSERGPSTHN